MGPLDRTDHNFECYDNGSSFCHSGYSAFDVKNSEEMSNPKVYHTTDPTST